MTDGSEWDGSAGLDDETDSLWIWLDSGANLAEVFASFNNSELTETIHTKVESMIDPTVIENVYEGYVRLTDLKISNDKINVRLNK